MIRKTILLSKGALTIVFNDLFVDKELVDEFGDIDDHGGYTKIHFYNWETQGHENLGTLPLSKIKEHNQLTVYGDNNNFWNNIDN